MVAKKVRCFASTSAGRLFDAVAALVDFTREATYEGQAAMWLEYQARRAWPQPPYPWPNLDHRPLLTAIVTDRIAGREVAEIAASFHAALAQGIVRQAVELCRQHAAHTVALSGGVFQNEVLLDAVADELEAHGGLRVVTNEAVPVNDGGIALGQAALAAAMIKASA
jgi:hydrogenase maturation protein HypF